MAKRGDRLRPTTERETLNAFIYAGIIVGVFIAYNWREWIDLLAWAVLTLAVGAILGSVNETISRRAFKRGYRQGQADAKNGVEDRPI